MTQTATHEKKQQLLMAAFAHVLNGAVQRPTPGNFTFAVYDAEPYRSVESVETTGPSGFLFRRFRANKTVRTQYYHQCKLLVRYNSEQATVYVYYCEEKYNPAGIDAVIQKARDLHPAIRDLIYRPILDVEPNDILRTEVSGGTSDH